MDNEEGKIIAIATGLFDQEEIFENCTVQVLTNTVTGEVSVGWWKNDGRAEGRRLE